MTIETHRDCLTCEDAANELLELYNTLGALTIKDIAKGVKFDVIIKTK